ncbi:substrate-binding domain-containing protein [Pendulispora rubella]|uniref:Substrate-binding domain-containing protein n=1 Tax=Pendulispora rubella TaxID=2741070 RepID=A0ABZ2LDS8_9BACT
MKRIEVGILAAVAAISVAACGSNGGASENEEVGSTKEFLTGPGADGIFGSDTLAEAMNAALAASPSTLVYYGSGSGNGEKCLRGQAVTYSGATYCSGTRDQSIAPMSRNLNGCQAGEKSNRIALDGIGIWSASSQTISDLSLADVRKAFCGTDGSGSAAACTATTWSTLSNGASAANPSATIVKYRRDDASGTTDTFKSILSAAGLACTAFCADVKVVVDTEQGPKLSTDGTGASSIQPPCQASDTATDCIGRLANANSSVLAYAGLGATAKAPAKALSVAGKTPTTANIRNLITSPASAYAFARFLYLNESTTNARDAEETKFYNWAFGFAPQGSAATKLSFETKLTGAGFIACTDPAASGHKALDCGTAACP